MLGLLLALLAAAVLGTGGAVYAANGASPGSALYGLDKATENVQYALTFGDHGKAELALQNATERLLEARDDAQNGDDEGVIEALQGYDEAYNNAIALLQDDTPEDQDLLEASLEEQDAILDEVVAPTCTDVDGDGVDDVTGESCDPPAPTCTDVDGDGVDDVTGEPCATEETFDSCVGADPHPVGQYLADQYGVTYETLMGYFCGTDATEDGEGTGRNGFGEIRLAFRIAEASGDPVEDILALRDSGLGWGQIKQEYGLIGNGKNAEEGTSEDGTATLSTGQENKGKSNNGNGNSGGNGNANGRGNSGGGNGNGGNTGNSNGGGNNNGNGNGGNGNSGGNGNGNGNGNGGGKP